MTPNRQLAAIMFTDIEGYSAAMQKNEEHALQLKNKHREIIIREHERFNGRVIQFYGDGTLSIFQSVIQAIQCGVQMQTLFRQDPLVPVRIGIHLGDIIVDDGQIFGDGVNMASRVESMAMPGSVVISDRVNEEIINHPEFTTVSLGIFQLKNIARSVELFAIADEGLFIPPPPKKAIQQKGMLRQKAHGKAKNSVAILPFINLSNDKEQDYFGEGVAEEIYNSLSAVKELKVAGRASSFAFKGTGSGLKEIGDKLGVVNVLDGSIRKQGNKVRVIVQLVNTESGFQVWSERYDRNMEDIFAIQDEIALSVTQRLKISLLEHDRKRILKSRVANTEAYELYLKGRFYLNRRGGAIIPAIKYFQLSLELDPDYALAYAGYADANLMSASYGFSLPKDSGARAKEAAEKAISLNPLLAEPYCSLGFYYTCCEWNWSAAEQNFNHSLELNPSYAQAHYWYGLNFLGWAMGDYVNSEAHCRYAIELEPLSSICYGICGPVLHLQRKFEETIDICRIGLQIDQNAFLCNLYYGWAHVSLKNYDVGIDVLEKLFEKSRQHHFAQAALSMALAMSGNRIRATELYEDLKARSAMQYISGTMAALAASHLDKLDEAVDWLEKASDARDPVLLSLKRESWVPETLRAHPYFHQLLRKIGFP